MEKNNNIDLLDWARMIIELEKKVRYKVDLVDDLGLSKYVRTHVEKRQNIDL